MPIESKLFEGNMLFSPDGVGSVNQAIRGLHAGLTNAANKAESPQGRRPLADTGPGHVELGVPAAKIKINSKPPKVAEDIRNFTYTSRGTTQRANLGNVGIVGDGK